MARVKIRAKNGMEAFIGTSPKYIQPTRQNGIKLAKAGSKKAKKGKGAKGKRNLA